MRTIDETIAYYKEKARIEKIKANSPALHNGDMDEINACLKCADEHEQLAGWLEDYKNIKQWKAEVMEDFCRYDANSVEELIMNARNRVMDELVTGMKSEYHHRVGSQFDNAILEMEKMAKKLKEPYIGLEHNIK